MVERPSKGRHRLRCAIYTRKSSEEGLEQEFNSLDALLHAWPLRSSHAHASFAGLDATAARDMPGVRLILTADMLAEAGLNMVPVDLPPPGHSFADWDPPAQPILAQDRVRFVGDILAFVVADTLAQARDAAEAITCDFQALPAITSLQRAPTIF